MIEAAGCGVAMKNAHEEIMKKANYVTEKDNNEDGVGDFLRSLFKIWEYTLRASIKYGITFGYHGIKNMHL